MKPGLQYDTGAIIALPALASVQPIRLLKNLTSVKKIFFPMSLMTSATIVAPGSYCEPELAQESLE